jgi:hypothetical protein
VIANAGRENAPGLPSTFVTAPLRPMIAPPRSDETFAEPVPEEVVPEPAPHVAGEPYDRS